MRGRQWIPLFCLVRVSLAQNPGDIKLWHSKPGMDEAVGVLSIFYQGRWGTVCDLDGFSKESGMFFKHFRNKTNTYRIPIHNTV